MNLIYDSVGSLNTPVEFFERLRAAGVQVLQFNPVNPLQAREGWRINHRDHRKIVIVDGRVAFTGGINISNVYSSGSSRGHGPSGSSPFGSGESKHPAPTDPGWRDTNVRISGPAVGELQKLFLATWQRQGGPQLGQRDWIPKMKPQNSEALGELRTKDSRRFPKLSLSAAVVETAKR